MPHGIDFFRDPLLLRSALDLMPQLISYVDREGIFRFANAAYLEWFSVSPEKIVGRKVHEVIGAEAMKVASTFMERALQGEEVRFQNFVPSPRGLRHVHVHYLPHRAEHGEVLGYLATIHDVTDLEESQKLLLESEQRFKSIFENAPVGIVQLDEQRRYVFANAAFLKFIGYTLDELKGLSMFDVTHPDDRGASREMADRFRESGFWLRRFEKRYVRRNGEVVWGLVTSQQVKDPSTGHMHLFTVIEDITDSRKRELELKRAESELHHFFVSSIDLMAVATFDGRFRRVNKAFVETLGFTEEELLQPYLNIVHPDDRDATVREMEKLNRGQPVTRFENRYRTKQGGYRTLSWLAAPDLENGLIYATARDITDRKLDEIKMAYSSKMASLGEMAGGIAHEINNPLAIIMGQVTNLQILLEENKPDLQVVREELAAIEKTGQRIAKIIRGLRAFSRNSETDPMIQVPVSRVIDDTLELCAERLKSRNIELEVNCPPELRVRCRPSQLSQVLMNLISNSYDAVEKLPAPWIRISVSRLPQTLAIAVEDSGHGIDPRLVGRIMQPFFTTKEVGRGTGLGLSISKGIVEEHGGLLRYDETSGHTRFVVELPDQS